MIFYFTGSGNSLWTAQRIQSRVGGDLVNITEAGAEYTLKEGEYLGIVFPVFYWKLPDRVKRFLKEVRISGSEPERTFIAVTCGGLTGMACEEAEKLMAAKGIAAGYKFSVKLVDNYVPIYTMPGVERVQELQRAGRKRISEFCDDMERGETGDYNEHRPPAPSVIAPLFRLGFVRSTKKFHVDEKCISCGLCVRICPVDAIEMHNGKPVWIRKKCEKCLGCLNRCPAMAIDYGSSARRHGRYVNPDVKF